MSLGDTLRAAREQAGLSVDDIMHVTKMTRDQVTGLETADYHAFSAPVYTKGFIKQYARAVGIDPAPLVAEYLAHPNGTEKNHPDGEMPVVALETISAESGALVSMRPAIPRVAPAAAPAPAEKKVAAAGPAPVPAPAPAPAAAPEKKVAAPEKTLLDFMEVPPPKPAPAPHPEKRIAPVEPGVVPPEPPSKLVRFDDPAPKPAPAPVAKNAPEPTAVGAVAATPYWNEVAPPVVPKPTAVPAEPFVFPGPSAFRRPEPAPAPARAPAPAPKPAPAPVFNPAPAPAPATVKKVAAEPDPRFAAVPHPVVSSAAQPAFVEDDLFATPERKPAGEAPQPAPTLFPDEDLAPAPDAPNPVRIFFSNCRRAGAKAFSAAAAGIAAFAAGTRTRVRAAAKARWVKPALLGVAGVVVLAAFAGLIASLFSGGGETPAGPDAAPAGIEFVYEGPVEIVPVLPAPRSFAK